MNIPEVLWTLIRDAATELATALVSIAKVVIAFW